MAGKAVAIDPGSHTWKVLGCKEGKGGLAVTHFCVLPDAEAESALGAAGHAEASE